MPAFPSCGPSDPPGRTTSPKCDRGWTDIQVNQEKAELKRGQRQETDYAARRPEQRYLGMASYEPQVPPVSGQLGVDDAGCGGGSHGFAGIRGSAIARHRVNFDAVEERRNEIVPRFEAARRERSLPPQ